MKKDFYDIVIVGAGASGLMAAVQSSKKTKKVLLIERKHKAGLKLRISGKGRCNLTNSCDKEDFIKRFGKNGRFLKYAFSCFFRKELLDVLGSLNIKCKLERGGRYFLESDNANEIAETLIKKAVLNGAEIVYNTKVKNIISKQNDTFEIICENKTGSKKNNIKSVYAKKLILATGGKSYPRTGSDGYGYKLAKNMGHTVVEPFPALVPIVVEGDICKRLEGLTLKNVNAEIRQKNKKIESEFGDMVFTQNGISGPIILSLSKKIVELIIQNKKNLQLSIDLKPALDHKTLDKRILRDINSNSKKKIKSLFKMLLPSKMVDVFIKLINLNENLMLSQITAEHRKKIRNLLKNFALGIKDYESFDKAIITAGGVKISEVDPMTMQSKKQANFFLAGEVIDIDADTGGFNLQAAFSTGYIAGISASK